MSTRSTNPQMSPHKVANGTRRDEMQVLLLAVNFSDYPQVAENTPSDPTVHSWIPPSTPKT